MVPFCVCACIFRDSGLKGESKIMPLAKRIYSTLWLRAHPVPAEVPRVAEDSASPHLYLQPGIPDNL